MTDKAPSKDEQIGFHKGALKTLAAERQELSKMISIVEQLMQIHLKGLQDLGVDLAKEAQKEKESESKHQAHAPKRTSKQIEEMLRK